MTDLPTTIHNERTKLTATWLNGVAVAILAVGGFAPMFTAIYSGHISLLLPIGAAICFALSIALHYWARRTLKGLRE